MRKKIAIILAMLFMFSCIIGCTSTNTGISNVEPIIEQSSQEETSIVTTQPTNLTVGLITLHD